MSSLHLGTPNRFSEVLLVVLSEALTFKGRDE